jgi:hypothetical protein
VSVLTPIGRGRTPIPGRGASPARVRISERCTSRSTRVTTQAALRKTWFHLPKGLLVVSSVASPKKTFMLRKGCYSHYYDERHSAHSSESTNSRARNAYSGAIQRVGLRVMSGLPLRSPKCLRIAFDKTMCPGGLSAGLLIRTAR